jgi:hypothetical protein
VQVGFGEGGEDVAAVEVVDGRVGAEKRGRRSRKLEYIF